MNGRWVMTILLGIAGAYALLGAVLNWNCLVHGYKSNMVTGVVGEKAARVMYGALGAILLAIAIVAAISLVIEGPGLN